MSTSISPISVLGVCSHDLRSENLASASALLARVPRVSKGGLEARPDTYPPAAQDLGHATYTHRTVGLGRSARAHVPARLGEPARGPAKLLPLFWRRSS